MYRNDDPPDEPEHPECCDEPMTIDGRVLRCETCHRCEQLPDYPDDYDPPCMGEMPDNTCMKCGKPTDCIYCSDECAPDCIHGNRPGDCDACDHLGDIAYDTARERR